MKLKRATCVKSPHIPILFLLISLFFLPLCSFAQGNGSSISGFVYSEDKQPSENATINATNTTNGFTATTISDKKGYFILRDLPVGSYTIQISAVNAATQVLKDNVLNFGDRLVLHQIIRSQ